MSVKNVSMASELLSSLKDHSPPSCSSSLLAADLPSVGVAGSLTPALLRPAALALAFFFSRFFLFLALLDPTEGEMTSPSERSVELVAAFAASTSMWNDGVSAEAEGKGFVVVGPLSMGAMVVKEREEDGLGVFREKQGSSV